MINFIFYRQKYNRGNAVFWAIMYICAIAILITLLLNFKKRSPEIEELRINHPASTLEVTGKGLTEDISATIIKHDPSCSRVAAKRFMWERVLDVKVKGSVAWALCRNIGLIALDISNPVQPKIIRTVHIEKFLWHLKIEGNTAYIACGKDGIAICDISSPANAKILLYYDTPNHCTDIASAHNLIYLSNGKHGISVFDPGTNTILSQIHLPGVSLRILAHQDKLFVFNQYTKRGFLHIFYIGKTPASPTRIKSIQFQGKPRDYLLKDNRIFLANGNAGIGVVELDSEGEAHFKTSVPTAFRSDRLALYEQNLMTFSRTGEFAVYSLYPDGTMELSSTAITCSRVFGADVFEHYAIIAANEEGINIVDLNATSLNRSNHLLAHLNARFEDVNWRVNSAGIFVRDAEKLYYLQRMPDGALKQTDELTYPAAEFFNGHNIYKSHIYAAIKGFGLHIGKIRPEGTLEHLKIIPLPEQSTIRVNAIVGYADNLYLGTTEGLKVFDISKPDLPIYLPHEDIPGDIRSITFGDGFAYLASLGDGIKIAPLNAGNKLGPTETIRFPRHLIPGGKSLDLVYRDGFLFAACGYRGILSIDVRKPHQPLIVDSFEISGFCKKVELKNNILGAQSINSAYLFDVENPMHIRMLGKVDNIEDFHLGDDEILGLRPRAIIRIPFPVLLHLRQLSNDKLEFALPAADYEKEQYSLYLNTDGKRSQLIGRLISTPSGASAAGWEFVRHHQVE